MDCCGGGVDILVWGCILLCGCQGDFYGTNNVSSILLSNIFHLLACSWEGESMAPLVG